MGAGVPFETPLPDGLYAQITHSPDVRTCRHEVHIFPWEIILLEVRDGDVIGRGSGCNPGKLLTEYNVHKVFLVGLNEASRQELMQLLRSEVHLIN
jgi:hypothetical protein